MRKHFFTLFMMLTGTVTYAQVGINNVNPHASSALDVTSTTRGFLPPRMTEAQRDDIDTPAEGLLIICTDCDLAGLHQFINGSWEAMSNSNQTGDYGTVVNPVTGKVWLDRNLGATQVATSSTDAAGYGDLYQWGRGADGHQVSTSGTTTTQATNWLAGSGAWNGLFVITSTPPNNWLSTAETYMWSGTAAENNPCPTGFRVPTNAEWEQERRTWTTNNAAGAFASPLKLPVAGARSFNNGLFTNGGFGGYWSCTVDGTGARYLSINSSSASMLNASRAAGYSVRCIKD